MKNETRENCEFHRRGDTKKKNEKKNWVNFCAKPKMLKRSSNCILSNVNIVYWVWMCSVDGHTRKSKNSLVGVFSFVFSLHLHFAFFCCLQFVFARLHDMVSMCAVCVFDSTVVVIWPVVCNCSILQQWNRTDIASKLDDNRKKINIDGNSPTHMKYIDDQRQRERTKITGNSSVCICACAWMCVCAGVVERWQRTISIMENVKPK